MQSCRSASRLSRAPTYLSARIGLRLVLGPSLFPAGDPNPELNLVEIAPGTFTMGQTSISSTSHLEHQVTLTYPFWIGRYEVTQSEWMARMNNSNPSSVQGSQLPVETVSWHDARAYCQALTQFEQTAGRVPVGYEYRLPTEAEWEYCSRAGTTTVWNTGPSLNTSQANFNSTSTALVGSYPANAWGLYDTHGNVTEWCLDSISYYGGAPIEDPFVQGSSTGWRIHRGGGWQDAAVECGSAFRAAAGSSVAVAWLGLRVVLAPTKVAVVDPNPALGMVEITPTTFTMGQNSISTTTHVEHVVTLPNLFWIGKYEVYQLDFQAVMQSNPSFFTGGFTPWLRPVESVTWDQARAYCQTLTQTERSAGRVPEGYEYRLPTEAEWECCCRAGTTSEWNTGASLTPSQANFGDPGTGQTEPVNAYVENPWGLHNTHGNVWEWCLDSYANYSSGPVVDPFVSTGSGNRVCRGGSWGSTANNCRSANRLSLDPTTGASSYVGFRVVLGRIRTP